jgi:nucleotide-binding universal stress UspA family protein
MGQLKNGFYKGDIKMEKRILVPLDGTEVGEAVLSKLDSLVFKDVRHADIEITLLNIIPIVNYNVLTTDERSQLPYTEDDQKELTRSASDYLGKIAGTLKDRGFKVKTMVKTGPAAEEIVKAAHEIDANLIAMSTRGRGGVIRWAIGSVTDKVIRLEGKIPVLAVNTTQKGDKSSVLPMGSLQSLMKQG